MAQINAIGISLFWEDGTPEGIRTAAVPGWAASAIAGPRDRIEAVLERPELATPGVYVLAGTEQDLSNTYVYVGESGEVANRIRSHNWNYEKKGAKEFWDQTYLITSNDSFFTKVHALYVESELIRRIRKAGRAKLSQIQPRPPKLDPGGELLAEQFLRFIEIVLPAMGLNVVSPMPAPTVEPGPVDPIQPPLTPTEEKRLTFWSVLLKKQKTVSDLFQNNQPNKGSWIATDRHGCEWAIVVLRNSTRVELYINRKKALLNKALFDTLAVDRISIDSDFDDSLLWQRLDDKKASRISFTIDSGLNAEDQWQATIDTVLDAMDRLYRVLSPYVIEYNRKQRK